MSEPSPSPDGEGGGPAEELGRRIAEKGPVTFDEFMEVALFRPEGGYYTSAPDSGTPWGPEGDYATNLDLSPVFARVMARQAREMWTLLGSPDRFVLVEDGAGRGLLGGGILEAAREMGETEGRPGFAEALHVKLVERNPNMGRAQEDRLRWHTSIEDVEPFAAGCVITNELIDSFPVHRVVVRDGRLLEVYVDLEDGCFADREGEPSTPELEKYFSEAGVRLIEGQRAEVNLAAGGWMGRAASLMERGFVLTIDYGWPAGELYSPERMGGTLMSHHRHEAGFDPYVRVGEQDLTAHVDFSFLARKGRESGLDVTGFTTQKNFLLGGGIAEEIADPGELGAGDIDSIEKNQGIKRLIMPGGPGDVFKVLVQHRGFNERPALSGFSFRDMARYL